MSSEDPVIPDSADEMKEARQGTYIALIQTVQELMIEAEGEVLTNLADSITAAKRAFRNEFPGEKVPE